MNSRKAFAKSLRLARLSKGLTQEDFSEVSGRTYLSSLERALKSPTLEKIDALAETMQIHPLTLLTLTYLALEKSQNTDKLLRKVAKQVTAVLDESDKVS